jgi:hypothetical protein
MKVFFVLFALCSFVIPAVAEAGKGLHKLYSQALSVVVAADGCISVKDKRTGRLGNVPVGISPAWSVNLSAKMSLSLK